MAQIEIIAEREAEAGWIFAAQVLDDRGVLRRHELKLAWADYNVWSASGADPPAAVAEAALRLLLTATDPEVLPERLDAARVRRLGPDADAQVTTLIRT